MSQDSNLWYVRGTIHNADGSVFHNQGRILAYHMFPGETVALFVMVFSMMLVS